VALEGKKLDKSLYVADNPRLLAIMFARLKMTVDEATTEFETIVKQVYMPQFCAPFERKQSLQDCIQVMLNRKKWNPDIKLEAELQQYDCAGCGWTLKCGIP
jgi:hypothetical protein